MDLPSLRQHVRQPQPVPLLRPPRSRGTFAGKPAEIRELFDRLRAIVETFGPITVQPYRDRVAFMSRVRFAGATPRQRWLTVEFWLTRRLDSPRIDKIETLYPDVHIHTLRVAGPDQLDTELAGWLAEAAAVGRQEQPSAIRTPTR